MPKSLQTGVRGVMKTATWILSLVLIISIPDIIYTETSSDEDDEVFLADGLPPPAATSAVENMKQSSSSEGEYFSEEEMDTVRSRKSSKNSNELYIVYDIPTEPSTSSKSPPIGNRKVFRKVINETLKTEIQPENEIMTTDSALQSIASTRPLWQNRLEYIITPDGHPFGPLFEYPNKLPIFKGMGGNSIVGALAYGLSQILSVAEGACLETGLAPLAIWQALTTKAPSKSFAFHTYLPEMIRYLITKLVELSVDSGIPTLQIRQLSQKLYGENFRICLLMGGENFFSVGISAQQYNISVKFNGQNFWGVAWECGIMRGLMGDYPSQSLQGVKTVILGDLLAEAFRPHVDSTVALLTRTNATIAESLVWVLDQIVPNSCETIVIVLGNRDVRKGVASENFFHIVFDLLQLLQKFHGSCNVIMNTLVPSQSGKQQMNIIDRCNSGLETFRDLGWCSLCRYGVRLRQQPVASWRLAFPENTSPSFLAAQEWWSEIAKLI